MVMDNLPRSGFSLINVCDAVLNGDLLPGKFEMPMLDARFAGHIPYDPDELIFQFNPPFRGQFSHFLK